jgi:F-type H+-transporting ATPase subunit delta
MAASGTDAAIERAAKDLDAIAGTMASSIDLRRMVASPIVPRAKKTSVFREIFGPRIAAGTMGFIELLINKQREPHLSDIIEQFGVLRDERFGIVAVEVTAALALTTAEERDLQVRLERFTGKKVRMRVAVDASIKGGLIVRIGDTVRDASIKRQMERLRERFLTGGPLLN